MHAYVRLLRRRSTGISLIAGLLSAVPVGMWPLVLVLGALDRGPAAAGLLAASFAVGNAAGILVQGALLVRLRSRWLLPAFAAGGLLALAAIAAGLAPLGAALAGLSVPAVTPAVRGWFAEALPGEERPGAYALVNVLFQVGIAIGPVSAAALAAAGLLPIGPGVAAASGLLAALLVVPIRGGARRVARPASTAPERRSRGGLLVLLAAAGAAGAGIGVLQVLLPLRSGATTAGAAFAALALGEVAGAVLAGGRVQLRHASVLLVGGGVVMTGVYVAIGSGIGAVVLLAAVLGVATAVQSLGSALSLDRYTTPERLPAAFAGQISVLICGTALGAWVAGLAPDAAPFAAAAGLLLAAAAVFVRLPPPGALRPRAAL